MRLSTIVKSPAYKSILNSVTLFKETSVAGVAKESLEMLCPRTNVNRTSCVINVLQRQMSSVGGINKLTDSKSGEILSQNSSDNFKLKKPFKKSYKPVNLSYISYEKKTQEKVNKDDVASSAKPNEKSPIIIQHGLFGTKKNWKTVGKEINFITKRAVYSLDGRNHGESPHSNEMTFALMAKDVKNFYEQKIQHEKISFMGHHGLGGRIGMMIAMLYPEILDKLIVVDSTPLMSVKANQRYSQLREAALTLKNIEPELRKCQGYKRSLAAEQAIEHIVKDKRDVAVMLSNLVNESSAETTAKKTKSQEEIITTPHEDNSASTEDGNSPLWKCNIDAFIDNPGIINFPAFDESKAFHGKTLFVQSTKSNYISEGDESEIRRIFPNAEFCWFKNGGSTWFHIEQHAKFTQAVVRFLEDTKLRTDNDNGKEHIDHKNVANNKN